MEAKAMTFEEALEALEAAGLVARDVRSTYPLLVMGGSSSETVVLPGQEDRPGIEVFKRPFQIEYAGEVAGGYRARVATSKYLDTEELGGTLSECVAWVIRERSKPAT